MVFGLILPPERFVDPVRVLGIRLLRLHLARCQAGSSMAAVHDQLGPHHTLDR